MCHQLDAYEAEARDPPSRPARHSEATQCHRGQTHANRQTDASYEPHRKTRRALHAARHGKARPRSELRNQTSTQWPPNEDQGTKRVASGQHASGSGQHGSHDNRNRARAEQCGA
jgi:hypothetical protein